MPVHGVFQCHEANGHAVQVIEEEEAEEVVVLIEMEAVDQEVVVVVGRAPPKVSTESFVMVATRRHHQATADRRTRAHACQLMGMARVVASSTTHRKVCSLYKSPTTNTVLC